MACVDASSFHTLLHLDCQLFIQFLFSIFVGGPISLRLQFSPWHSSGPPFSSHFGHNKNWCTWKFAGCSLWFTSKSKHKCAHWPLFPNRQCLEVLHVLALLKNVFASAQQALNCLSWTDCVWTSVEQVMNTQPCLKCFQQKTASCGKCNKTSLIRFLCTGQHLEHANLLGSQLHKNNCGLSCMCVILRKHCWSSNQTIDVMHTEMLPPEMMKTCTHCHDDQQSTSSDINACFVQHVWNQFVSLCFAYQCESSQCKSKVLIDLNWNHLDQETKWESFKIYVASGCVGLANIHSKVWQLHGAFPVFYKLMTCLETIVFTFACWPAIVTQSAHQCDDNVSLKSGKRKSLLSLWLLLTSSLLQCRTTQICKIQTCSKCI